MGARLTKDEKSENKLLDVRDGLTHEERVILHCLHKLQAERGGRSVDVCMLYGRVIEYIDIGSSQMQSILQTLLARE